jgi:hypothetical protein
MPRIRTYGIDIDTVRYAQRVKSGSGVTILPEPLKQINKFVIGVKKLGLWNSMVCWPMRSIHNAGTGSTVYSLGGLGTFNGSLVNSPTWSNQAIDGSTADSYMAVNSFSLNTITPSFLMVYNRRTPSEQTRPLLQNAPVNFGMHWFGQARTYMWGFDSTNTQGTAYTAQNGFWTVSGFNTMSIEIAGVGAPVSQPFYVFENNTFQGNLVAPVAPFNSRQNFSQQFELYYGVQRIPFFLFINGRGAQNLRYLYRSTLGIGLNLT